VTFDDGYEDNATVAAPILERLGVKGAFYVVTEFAGTDRRFWWERVAAMLRATGRRAVDVQAIFPSAQGDAHAEARALPLSTDEQRDRAHATLCDRMRPLPPEALDAALVQLQEHLGVEVPEAGRDFPLMGWDRLRELDRRGHEVGCHSASHANLRTAAPAIVRREILTARDRIAGELGAAPRTFAYPYGYWGPYAADVIREAGFSLAFAEGSGVVDARAALHALPRVGLNRRWPFAVTYNIHRALATAS
jgi:peptidoglycan/xylan/chitin deacetylase (PgdA/CDA1 family)